MDIVEVAIFQMKMFRLRAKFRRQCNVRKGMNARVAIQMPTFFEIPYLRLQRNFRKLNLPNYACAQICCQNPGNLCENVVDSTSRTRDILSSKTASGHLNQRQEKRPWANPIHGREHLLT